MERGNIEPAINHPFQLLPLSDRWPDKYQPAGDTKPTNKLSASGRARYGGQEREDSTSGKCRQEQAAHTPLRRVYSNSIDID